MNEKFELYVSTLKGKERDIAREAVIEYMKGLNEDKFFAVHPDKVYNYCKDLTLEETEVVEVLLLRKNNKAIKRVRIASGGLDFSAIDIRVIFKEALLAGATGIIVIHNHPSGNPHPSVQDDEITKRIKEAGRLLKIRLIDHLIITDDRYYTYSGCDWFNK